ncbi:hypothetical protein FHX64_000202 [Microbacter margulisiae]|uniref:Uncharacterized protein n=1 Tax=Microbacter margulisiae TaxID=1350067 RepID=A0A7W5DP67_9PORP|nr:hypothetical protein [Microbacter margulisiae]
MKLNTMDEHALLMLESLPILGLSDEDEQSRINQTILPCKGYCHQLCVLHFSSTYED